MRQGLKRFVAVLLLICTLASFVVPATFADNGSQETVAQEFDFVLYDAANHKATNSMFENGGTKMLGSSNCSCGCGKKFKVHLEEKYEELGWKIQEHNVASEDNITFRENGGWGLRVKAKDCWVAIRLNVTAPGTYTVKYTASKSSEQKVNAYVFSANQLGSGTVASLMASANKTSLGEISMTSSDISKAFENTWNISAAGEQIIVIENLLSNM